MRDFAILLVHVIGTICRLWRPNGARSVIAESILIDGNRIAVESIRHPSQLDIPKNPRFLPLFASLSDKIIAAGNKSVLRITFHYIRFSRISRANGFGFHNETALLLYAQSMESTRSINSPPTANERGFECGGWGEKCVDRGEHQSGLQFPDEVRDVRGDLKRQFNHSASFFIAIPGRLINELASSVFFYGIDIALSRLQ
jgi:hypothetical protein